MENKETLHTNTFESEIIFISWVQECPGSEKVEDVKKPNLNSSSKYLPKLPTLSRSYSSTNKSLEDNYEDTKKIKDQSVSNLLIIGLDNRKLYLSIFGLLSCGVINLEETFGKNCKIIDADLTKDFKTLFVVLSSLESEDKNLNLGIYNTSILFDRSRELYIYSLCHGSILSLMEYLSNTMLSITETCENILLEMDTKFSLYASRVPRGSVSADLLELLMMGDPSSELELFLIQDLTAKGLKKFGHAIEISYTNIQKLILRHLNAVGQGIHFKLAELQGMARRTDHFEQLGLEEESAARSLSASGSLLMKATEVQLVIDGSMKNFKSFFRWLYIEIVRLNDERLPPPEIMKVSQQEIAFIAEYISQLDGGDEEQQKFNLERIGQYLVDKPLVLPLSEDSTTWTQFSNEQKCLRDSSSVLIWNPENSLVREFNILKRTLTESFARTESAISKSFSLVRQVSLPVMSENSLKISHSLLSNDEDLILSLTINGILHIIQVGLLNEDAMKKSIQISFNQSKDGPLRVVDVQFYTPEILSLLLEQSEESRGAVFGQLPIKTALEKGSLVEANSVLEPGALRLIENMVATRFAVSGARKVAVVLAENCRKVRLFEMEVEEEEEEDETMDTTGNSIQD